MHCHIARIIVEPRLASRLADRDSLARQRHRRRRTERHDQARVDEFQLLHQPPAVMLQLARRGLLMDAPFPTLLELEMLHGIGDVDLVAIDPGLLHGAVKQLPGKSDEGVALLVILIPGLLADKGDGRPPGPSPSTARVAPGTSGSDAAMIWFSSSRLRGV